ncbi:unnamed protein product [Adineta steineri]|uniref:BRCT domain-containing protein n=1 Tax=Adineta steineri TaxID=433720 RepID=A0A813PJX3_9BILA|nr:unnamed protein product [Adineta steineri]CAF3931306.1 unnamed protein product [Adineta steineri]
MSSIKFKKILSCSSEDQIHCAENLLKSKKWLSSTGTDDRIICIIELEKPSLINSLDIGNNGSAFIELFVSNSDDDDDWTILLPSTILMTPKESRSNTNCLQIKNCKSFHFNKTSLNQKWTRLKIICDQKFNHTNQFGLNFIKLYSDENNQIEPEKNSSIDEIQKHDKSQIMKNIVFVVSGFKNPVRTELRKKGTAMGAIYNDDWDEKCTHLISAFSNTPKSNQVQQTGKGFIVNKKWILDCYKQNQLLFEKSYEFNETKSEISNKTSKTKKKEDVEESNNTKDVKRKSITKNNDDVKTNKLRIGEIPDFFHEKHFYVSYGDYDDNTLLAITRVILAYDGILERQITSDVKYVITNRMWNQDFEKISRSNPEINFINLDWLQDCHNENQFMPLQSYLIVP